VIDFLVDFVVQVRVSRDSVLPFQDGDVSCEAEVKANIYDDGRHHFNSELLRQGAEGVIAEALNSAAFRHFTDVFEREAGSVEIDYNARNARVAELVAKTYVSTEFTITARIHREPEP
jgi:hypothetical protein